MEQAVQKKQNTNLTQDETVSPGNHLLHRMYFELSNEKVLVKERLHYTIYVVLNMS